MFDRPTVVIMSGLPGSGKSYYSLYLMRNNLDSICVSSDYYMIDSNGNYKFNPTMLGECHGKCFRSYIRNINEVIDTIIVDNCGSKLHNVSPYILAAQAYDYDHLIVCCNASVETCLARKTHNVPEHTIRNMEKNLYEMYAKLPMGWKVKHINTDR